MRRADAGRCPKDPGGKHRWIEVTKVEDASQGLLRFACATCGTKTMEKDPNSADSCG